MKHTDIIKDNRLYKSLYGGKNRVSPEFVLYYKKNKIEKNRMGITVSKKIGHAFERNRAKRVIRESYRLTEDNIKPGYDFIFVARSATKSVPMQCVRQRLTEIFLSENLLISSDKIEQ